MARVRFERTKAEAANFTDSCVWPLHYLAFKIITPNKSWTYIPNLEGSYFIR